MYKMNVWFFLMALASPTMLSIIFIKSCANNNNARTFIQRAWSGLFSIFFAPLLSGILLFESQFLISLNTYILSIIVVVCISRISEVIVGFYGDALDKIDSTRQGYKNKRTNMSVSERLNWLGLSYIEVLQYYAVLAFLTNNIIEPSSFGETCLSGADALFFSVVTITTTGYGDFVPKGDIGRLLAGCETLTGIVLLVAVLASYISSSIEANDDISWQQSHDK